MSWSGQTKATWSTEQENADVIRMIKCSGQDDLPEADEAKSAAKEAAIALVNSGAIGKGQVFDVSIDGHANPGHEAKVDWVNDYIHVTVRQQIRT